jgi:uncharacterized protein (DUF1800 family)
MRPKEETLALPDKEMMAAIAVTRFGLGALPGELEAARADPKGFLKSQIRREGADQPAGDLPSGYERLSEFRAYQRERQQEKAMLAKDPAMARQAFAGQVRKQAAGVQDEFLARSRLAMTTRAAFRERWTAFWADHFTVSAVKGASANQSGPFEREAIRPHVFGRFEDLLIASSTHPGMLLYLDQVQSVGPDSPLAQRARLRPAAFRQSRRPAPGLNENLAREIMELHTVGLGAHYSQTDVTEFARAMTGLSVGGPNDGARANKVVFRDPAHEPGTRTIMGRRYPDEGKLQPISIMRDLAAHPATANHISVQLARHFVADDPPKALIERLQKAFMDSKGDLALVAAALIEAPEAWAPQAAKFKTPYDFVISSYRAAGQPPRNPMPLIPQLNQLGQRPFSAPSPKGWPDDVATWAAPDQIVKRLAWSQSFAAQNANLEPMKVAQAALGARLTAPVQSAILSAESRPEALAILIMSPEFQRR